jgi:zinc-ribbon family
MIIYGTKATHLRTQNISGQCRSCGTSNNLQLSAFQKYAHIFWIPFFPIGKEYVIQCNHCRQVLDENEIRDAYRTSYEDMKRQLSIPIWTFSGLGLIAFIVVSSIISGQIKDKENRTWIQSPVKGDIYKYKTEEGEYSLLKVSEISGDTIFVFPNNYAATKIMGLTKLLEQGDSTYSEVSYPILKGTLLKMLEEEDIRGIIRR